MLSSNCKRRVVRAGANAPSRMPVQPASVMAKTPGGDPVWQRLYNARKPAEWEEARRQELLQKSLEAPLASRHGLLADAVPMCVGEPYVDSLTHRTWLCCSGCVGRSTDLAPRRPQNCAMHAAAVPGLARHSPSRARSMAASVHPSQWAWCACFGPPARAPRRAARSPPSHAAVRG